MDYKDKYLKYKTKYRNKRKLMVIARSPINMDVRNTVLPNLYQKKRIQSRASPQPLSIDFNDLPQFFPINLMNEHLDDHEFTKNTLSFSPKYSKDIKQINNSHFIIGKDDGTKYDLTVFPYLLYEPDKKTLCLPWFLLKDINKTDELYKPLVKAYKKYIDFMKKSKHEAFECIHNINIFEPSNPEKTSILSFMLESLIVYLIGGKGALRVDYTDGTIFSIILNIKKI